MILIDPELLFPFIDDNEILFGSKLVVKIMNYHSFVSRVLENFEEFI